MATSGSFTVISNTYAKWNFYWSVDSYQQGTNPRSTISWDLTLDVNGTVPTTVSPLRVPYEISVGGSSYSGTGYFYNNGTTSGDKSNTKTIYHNEDGTGSFTVILTAGGTTVKTIVYELDPLAVYAKIVSVSDFNDEENPTISYNNVSGELVDNLEVGIVDSGGDNELVPYREASKTSSSYTFSLTADERSALRSYITTGNSNTVRFVVRTTIEGSYYTSSTVKTLTLVNYMPILNPSVRDTNQATIELTGNDSVLVKYFSTAYFDTGAEAIKEATINHQYIINGSKVLEDYTSNTGYIENIDSNTFYFGVTDSRGYTTRDFVVVDLIPYEKLTSSLSLQPLTLAGDLTLEYEGVFFNENFGAKQNSLEFEYGIRENDGDIHWVNIEPTVTYNGNRYKANYTITGLNPESFYRITGNVIDALMSVQTQSQSITSTPIFDWSKTDFKHNTSVYLTKNLSLRTIDNDGNDVSVLNPCNPQGALVLGWGQYDKANGDTSVYGNNINLTAKESVKINGAPIGGTVLWEGAYYMNASQVAKLSAPISEQVNGIILVFSLYTDGSEEDVSINTFFVSKKEVELLPNAPHTFFMMINSGFSVIGAKYLYINDTAITGHATNSVAGTNNNMTYSNNRFVLRYVIGV